MKRFGLIVVVIVAVLLAGCLAPKVNFTIAPDPIEVTFGQTAIDNVSLEVKLAGFGIDYTVESAIVELLDENGAEAMKPIEEPLNVRIPVVVGGLGKSVDLPSISLEAFYKDIDPDFAEPIYDTKLKGKTYTLKITLTGKNHTSNTANIVFK